MNQDSGQLPAASITPDGDDSLRAATPAGEGEASRASSVTLYDVARIAGVSTATVSRVVHGQDRVRAATRARVQQVIEQLGYVPDGAAQSLSRRRKNVIGLVCVEHVGLTPRQYDIESMSLLFYDEVLRGVEARLRDHDLSLLITYLREDDDFDWVSGPGGALTFFPRLLSLSGKVDGLLIGEGIVPAPVLARLAERLPVVVIAGDPGERAADVVTADNRAGSAALVTHLVSDHGKRRLFHVDGPPTAPDAKERRLALADVLHAHPEAQLVGSYNGLFSVQSGEDAATTLLGSSSTSLPDAVVCANDQMAIGVLQALARAGVRVPGDVAVTGFDDIFVGGLVEPTLTTVHQPMRLLGEQACARLLERIATPGLPPKVQLLPTELVLRSSCGCPRGTATRQLVPPVEAVHPADSLPGPTTDGRRPSGAPV
ncbi:MAG: LacI family DNA-binding transcriptional regulator [Streptosporangiaceae bacterium]